VQDEKHVVEEEVHLDEDRYTPPDEHVSCGGNTGTWHCFSTV